MITLNNIKDISRFLAQARRESGKTQNELAEECGKSVETIRKIEQGRVENIQLETLILMTKKCGLKIYVG